VKRSAFLMRPAVAVRQPLGEFYVTSMGSDVVSSIAFADVRRLASSATAVEEYLGIQRRLDPERRAEIASYVRTVDATFPTSVVIAIEDERCISYDDNNHTLTFFDVESDEDGPAVQRQEIARILDGQHRLAGLKDAEVTFDLPVTVFPALDVADEAYIFATVNIAQTKVNTSLAYDLLAYARTRSPEKTCHDIAVTLNSAPESPFEKSIKRLGTATPGVVGETLTQATFVKALLPYISRDPLRDREDLRRGNPLSLVKDAKEMRRTPFRNLFIEERDDLITNAFWKYFDSVKRRWPIAWDSKEKGQIIKRTNGFRAFMNVFGDAYYVLGGNDRKQPNAEDYLGIWSQSSLKDADFSSEVYLPGTSGEKRLTESLRSAIGVYRTHGAKRKAVAG